MKKVQESSLRGKEIEYNDEEELYDLTHFDKEQHAPGNRDGYRAGTIGPAKRMKESEQPGDITDQTDQEKKTRVLNAFSEQIQNIITKKLMGSDVELKITGNPRLVDQVTKLINMETAYLKAIMNGQASDTPALQKNKAIIEKEANYLDRMLKTHDFWPFK